MSTTQKCITVPTDTSHDVSGVDDVVNMSFMVDVLIDTVDQIQEVDLADNDAVNVLDASNEDRGQDQEHSVTYCVIEDGTSKNKKILVESNGHTYNVKRRRV